MRAINHAMTGALIGLVSGNPVVAAPAAVISHFVLDTIPHHGANDLNEPKTLRSKLFRYSLVIDAASCGLLVALLATQKPVHWLLAACCAFLAAAPDFLYLNRFITAQRHKSWQPNKFVKWTRDIQWFQRPIGAVVEIVWFAGVLAMLLAATK